MTGSERDGRKKEKNVCLFFEQDTPHFHFTPEVLQELYDHPYSQPFVYHHEVGWVGEWVRNVGLPTCEYRKSFFGLKAKNLDPVGEHCSQPA